MTTTLAFLDTETTGLDRQRHHVWDIGIVLRKPGCSDEEYSWLVRPELSTADPYGLRVGRFYERFDRSNLRYEIGHSWCVNHPDADVVGDHQYGGSIAADLGELLDGATIVGAVPDFDDAMLGRFLRESGHGAPSWHYHLVDVETLAAGALKLAPPWDFDMILGRYGLKYDEADRHTAIGDARMARDLYDAVMTGAAHS